ncbi:nuclear transport factor 2 family protein [Aestuariibacter sp. GS-14]|uniref:nuclear transport factor 2 family protein n=1 Tax=Aestuariibacter sp. GS-14 TaxID=2590670 RepID=UPI001C63E89E|nr:nuclear transport factor 2 family protein [Aestuariibacter sp. GS-14]
MILRKRLPAAALAVALLSTGMLGLSVGEVMAKERPVISKGDHAYIALQVQNAMSRHAYYHAAGMNLEEVDHLWVSRTGPNAKTATFASPIWVMSGIETVRNAYGKENQANREKALKAIQKVVPDLKFEEANLGAGHEWAMHTNTTPIIEVAGDGKTAKGVWYSPGMGLMASVQGDDAPINSVFFWEKYAGDFILEDGKWKIWHLQMAYDFTPGLPKEMTDAFALINGELDAAEESGPMREAGERMASLPPGFLKPAYSYPIYSPARPGLIYPRLPEPYYTFSETFSYCNCDETSRPDNSATMGIVALKD